MALQGMPLEVINDIDLQTTTGGAYAIEQALAAQTLQKVRFTASERIRSHFGSVLVAGIKVEIMGGMQKMLPNGDWETPVNPAEYTCLVEFEGLRLPVIALEYEEQAYRLMGREEKANAIRQWLKESGFHPRIEPKK